MEYKILPIYFNIEDKAHTFYLSLALICTILPEIETVSKISIFKNTPG